MLRDPVERLMAGGDQSYYQRYFRAFPDRVGLDTGCKLLCATQGVGPAFDVELRGLGAQRRLVNIRNPGHAPAVVHFVSDAHWPIWRGGAPTTEITDIFTALYPTASRQLFGGAELLLTAGEHQAQLVELRGAGKQGYLLIMRLILCLKCRLLGSRERDCNFATGWFGETCLLPTLLLLAPLCALLAAMLVAGIVWCQRVRLGERDKKAKRQ
eukprot:gnl/TRDRNA2_/TRDRNA2_207788_c0_seq1.p1 gnl/TRDRNA2_/TRDRNA2_207788_c0~~gnl/TRDRNA2_/TRDRNA2_207788_c0_seq1.p1  ORF type:complete len:219 (-),score=36.30 gnl/TRDRNA2_/TRDRNA2_207788_c0_seq1:4-639(-)